MIRQKRIHRPLINQLATERPSIKQLTIRIIQTLHNAQSHTNHQPTREPAALINSFLGRRWWSQSRLGEWLRSLDDTDIAGFADALTQVTDAAWSAGYGPDPSAASVTDPVIVDVDSTFTETHGTFKDGTDRRNYQGLHGYYPLLAVEASTGQVIAANLRKGNATMDGVAAFTHDTLERTRRLAGNDTALVVRADSGFYIRDLFDTCVAHDARFSVTVRQYAAVRDLITDIPNDQWQRITDNDDDTSRDRIDIAAVPFEIKGRWDKNHARGPIRCRLIVRRSTTPTDTGHPQMRLFDLVDHHASSSPTNPATPKHYGDATTTAP